MNWQIVEKLINSRSFTYHDDYLDNSELLMKNEFVFQHVYNMEPSPEKYQLTDWQVSPNGDPEWLFVLKRQEYLQDLIYSYLETRNVKYLEKVKYYIFNWIENNYDNLDAKYTTWRTIDTGIRLLNWASAVDILKKNHLLSEDELQTLKAVVNDQVQYLKDNYIDKYDLSNWGVLITTGVLTFDAVNRNVVKPELIDWTMQRFVTEMQVQVDDEGMHWEQSPLYFIEVFRSALCVFGSYKEARLNLDGQIEQILSRMLNAFEYQMLPDGKLLQQGDTDAVPTRDLFNSAWNMLHEEDLNGKIDFLTSMFYYHQDAEVKERHVEGRLDAFVSGNFFNKKNNDYLHVFNGNLGSGHGHASNGQIDLMLNGDQLLIDPGRYTYVDSEIRRSLKSGVSHNVVLVDGQYPIVPKDSWKFKSVAIPVGNEVKHVDGMDAYKLITLNSDGDLYRTRYVTWLAERSTLVVIDVVRNGGKHIASSNWVFDQKVNVDIKSAHEAVLNTAHDKYQLFTSEESAIGVYQQDYSPRYNEKSITSKIKIEQPFEDYYINFTVIGKADDVQHLNITQAGSEGVVVAPENGYAFRLSYGAEKLDFVLQHLNTFTGHKLYYVDGVPTYGELSVISKTDARRLF